MLVSLNSTNIEWETEASLIIVSLICQSVCMQRFWHHFVVTLADTADMVLGNYLLVGGI